MPADAGRRAFRWKRGLGWGALGLGVLVVGAGAWLGYSGQEAKRDLEGFRRVSAQMRAEITAGDVTAARAHLPTLVAYSEAAEGRTDGPLWGLARRVPWLGRPFRVVRGVTTAADEVATDVLPPALDAAAGLRPETVRRGAQIDLAVIQRAAPAARRAAAAARILQQRVHRLPRDTWLGSLDRARAEAADEFDSLAESLHGAMVATRVLPSFLGQQGARRYLLVFQNNAEARPTGGLPGSFAVLRAENGRLALERTATDSDVGVFASGVVELDDGFGRRYAGEGALTDVRNSNLSAHFPYAARIWTAMWERRFAQRLDGAIATDPLTLSYLLRATGPTQLPDGTAVTADTIVDYVERRIYADIPDPGRRKPLLSAIAAQAFRHAISAPAGSSRGLVEGLRRGIQEGRVLVASLHPDEQSGWESTRVGGVVPERTGPYAQVVLTNAAGSKLDYYVRTSVRYAADGCAGRVRRSAVTITLENTAPKSGLPPYVTIRADRLPSGPAGSERLTVGLYATPGAELLGVTEQGQPSTAAIDTERRHPVYEIDLTIPPGERRTVAFSLREPTVAGAALVPAFPAVLETTTRVDVPVCA